MTLVLTWLDMHPGSFPSIWTAADTQVSAGETILTLEGAKIMELNIVCRNLTDGSDEIYYRTSIGFSYAGSTLTAFNTYAMLSTIMSNLGGPDRSYLPDYLSILQKAQDIVKLYTPGKDRIAEISIWGFCPVSRQPFIGAICWNTDSNCYEIKHHIGYTEKLEWVILGERHAKERADELIRQRISSFTDTSDYKYWRQPFFPLREIIQSRECAGVGGGIQLAIVNILKFRHTFVTTPPADGTTKWGMQYRKFEVLDELGINIGKAFISITGMHVDI